MEKNNINIEKLLDNLTAGLEADPEVRLDVKSEMRSHLDEKIAEGIRDGLSEQESERWAIKAFGDTIQISDEVASANTAKMSLRSKLRKLGYFLLLPAVVICALFTFDPNTLLLKLSYPVLIGHDKGVGNPEKSFWFFERYTPDEKLILYGDKSRDNKAESQKAIWERFPENKVYLANYIITLLSFSHKTEYEREKLFAELEMAKQKDPENALYNYITASLLLDKACKIEHKQTRKRVGKSKRIRYGREYSITVKDRNMMNRVVDEYLKGIRKKYCRSYILKMLDKRLEIMGRPVNIKENIQQIALAASCVLPHLTRYRELSVGCWKYAETLQDEGKGKVALKTIGSWRRYLAHLAEDSDLFISALITVATAKAAEKIIPSIYRRAGKNHDAENVEKVLKRIIAVDEKRRDESDNFNLGRYYNKIGVLGAMLLPHVGKLEYTAEDYELSNKVEYAAIERFLIVLLNFIFLIFVVGGSFTVLYWRIRSRQKALLLAPPLKLMGRILLRGFILPLGIYFLISFTGIIGGHEYNISYNVAAVAAQFTLLLVSIPTVIFMQTRKHVRRRCLELNLPVSCGGIRKALKITCICMLPILAVLAVLPPPYVYKTANTGIKSLPGLLGLIALGIIVIALIMLLIKFFTTIFSGDKYALYYGALAKTLTPVFAAGMILITVCVLPALQWREADLISRDKIIYGQPKGFSTAEFDVTQKLKKDMLKALQK